MPLHLIFLVVAVVLFIIDSIFWWMPQAPFTGRLTSLGLAFFAGAFIVT